jgi:hypothetical protein
MTETNSEAASSDFQTVTDLNPPTLSTVSIKATVLLSRIRDDFEHIRVAESTDDTDEQAVIEILNETDTRKVSEGDTIQITNGTLLGDKKGRVPVVEAFYDRSTVEINS